MDVKKVITIVVGAFIILLMVMSIGGMLETETGRIVTGYFASNEKVKTGAVEISATTTQVAETFTPATNYEMSKTKLLLYRSATAPESLTIELFLADTTTHKPTGSALATGTIDCSAITESTDGLVYEVTYAAAYDVLRDTEYATVVSRASVVAGSIFVCYTASDYGYSMGYPGLYFLSTDTGGTWDEDTTKDLYFAHYGVASTAGMTQVLFRMMVWILPIGAIIAVVFLIVRLLRGKRIGG